MDFNNIYEPVFELMSENDRPTLIVTNAAFSMAVTISEEQLRVLQEDIEAVLEKLKDN